MTTLEAHDYATKPPISHTFRHAAAKDLTLSVVRPRLQDVIYHADQASKLTRDISDAVRERLSATWPRYKFLVQTWLSERSDGLHLATRALWDPATDTVCDVTSDTSHLLCRVVIFVVSSTDFDYVSFEGEFVNIGELKYLISKKTGVLKDRSTVIELFDSQTGEEYVNANTMVQKSASVVAKRSPAVRPPPILAHGRAPTLTKEVAKNDDVKVEENLDEALGPGIFAPDKTEEADNAAISELVKGYSEVWRTDLNMQAPWRRGRGREAMGRLRRGGLSRGRANLPPPGYICHRCNTPGHFIDECPTNGDPAYDFVRVRYPTGIPSSMLEKDEQGGLMMPDGQRARLKPNMEKFKLEMEGVPSGDPEVERLPAAGGEGPMEQDLPTGIGRDALTSLMPLMMHVLPSGRDEDLRTGFFGGEPFNQETFDRCREAYLRVHGAYTTPSAQPPVWTQPPQPSHLSFDNGNWRQPPPGEMYGDRPWRPSFADYGPPRKASYLEQPHGWHPHMRPPYYDHGFPRPPPYERYGPEPPMPYAAPTSDAAPALHSKVVRLQSSLGERPNHLSSEDGRAHHEDPKDLPYGFERSLHCGQELERDRGRRLSRSRSRSPNKSRRRRSAHSSDLSSSIKKSKLHRRSKDRSHHRRKERRDSKRNSPVRHSPSAEREFKKHSQQVQYPGPVQEGQRHCVGRWDGSMGVGTFGQRCRHGRCHEVTLLFPSESESSAAGTRQRGTRAVWIESEGRDVSLLCDLKRQGH